MYSLSKTNNKNKLHTFVSNEYIFSASYQPWIIIKDLYSGLGESKLMSQVISSVKIFITAVKFEPSERSLLIVYFETSSVD